jgi:hypothetical protein
LAGVVCTGIGWDQFIPGWNGSLGIGSAAGNREGKLDQAFCRSVDNRNPIRVVRIKLREGNGQEGARIRV